MVMAMMYLLSESLLDSIIAQSRLLA